MNVHDKNIYEDVEFSLYDSDGVLHVHRGAYILCDGVYHMWRVLQCPLSGAGSEEERRYAKWLESVRKDVECFFGILKGRFRLLKFGINFASSRVVDNIFQTCCAIHNQLLDVDGLDREWQEGGALWEK